MGAMEEIPLILAYGAVTRTQGVGPTTKAPRKAVYLSAGPTAAGPLDEQFQQAGLRKRVPPAAEPRTIGLAQTLREARRAKAEPSAAEPRMVRLAVDPRDLRRVMAGPTAAASL